MRLLYGHQEALPDTSASQMIDIRLNSFQSTSLVQDAMFGLPAVAGLPPKT